MKDVASRGSFLLRYDATAQNERKAGKAGGTTVSFACCLMPEISIRRFHFVFSFGHLDLLLLRISYFPLSPKSFSFSTCLISIICSGWVFGVGPLNNTVRVTRQVSLLYAWAGLGNFGRVGAWDRAGIPTYMHFGCIHIVYVLYMLHRTLDV